MSVRHFTPHELADFIRLAIEGIDPGPRRWDLAGIYCTQMARYCQENARAYSDRYNDDSPAPVWNRADLYEALRPLIDRRLTLDMIKRGMNIGSLLRYNVQDEIPIRVTETILRLMTGIAYCLAKTTYSR